MKLYWDMDNQEFVAGLTSPQKISEITLYLRDQVDITLYTCRPTTSGTAYYALENTPAGQAPLCGIKLGTKAGLDGGYLVNQNTWTLGATGTYTATLDLNTTELIAAMGSEIEEDFVLEFTLNDADNKHHSSSQMDCTIKLDLNRGTEAAAASAYLGNNALLREENRGGQKVLVLYNSDGVEYGTFNPPGA